MKKTYEKPMLYAETFELMEHIASGSCLNATTPTTFADYSCPYYAEGYGIIFMDGNASCTDIQHFDEGDVSQDPLTCYQGIATANGGTIIPFLGS